MQKRDVSHEQNRLLDWLQTKNMIEYYIYIHYIYCLSFWMKKTILGKPTNQHPPTSISFSMGLSDIGLFFWENNVLNFINQWIFAFLLEFSEKPGHRQLESPSWVQGATLSSIRPKYHFVALYYNTYNNYHSTLQL